MDASYKIQRGIHVHLIQFFMCPEFWVHIKLRLQLLLFMSAAGKMITFTIYLHMLTRAAPESPPE